MDVSSNSSDSNVKSDGSDVTEINDSSVSIDTIYSSDSRNNKKYLWHY